MKVSKNDPLQHKMRHLQREAHQAVNHALITRSWFIHQTDMEGGMVSYNIHSPYCLATRMSVSKKDPLQPKMRFLQRQAHQAVNHALITRSWFIQQTERALDSSLLLGFSCVAHALH
ncbi:hypothetical protein JHK87_007190 [Glycine soja]|nr:hypothetical protein JHK87_007190 [Glycine soja]